MDITPNSANAVRVQTGELTAYPLRLPIKLKDGSELTVLHLRRPKGRELRDVELTGRLKVGVIMDIVGKMCSLLPDEVDEIDGADVLEIVGVVSPFLAVGDGEMLSP